MKKLFVETVRDALAASPVLENLAKHEAIVLERLARGGGATNWYYCRNERSLDQIEERLRPGSVVSFYFDDRIGKLWHFEEVCSRVDEVVAAVGECVVGVLANDEIGIEVGFVSGRDDLSEFLNGLPSSSPFFVGEFPARDNDGKDAATILLPDADGVVREHPH